MCSLIVSCRYLRQCKFVLSRSFSVHARESALGGIRAYSRFKFEYYPEDPMAFVAELSDNDRQKLKDCLDRYAIEMEEEHIEKPSNRKLRLVMYQAALPFIGFGFFDNLIMITAGEYIDATIGITLAISTMAVKNVLFPMYVAAALGNTLSDLMGIGLSHFVERTCRRLGVPNPMLTAAEARYHTVKWMTLVGKCCGILLGCVIGMSPLLWFDSHHS